MPDKSLEEMRAQVGESKVTVTGLEVERGKVAEFRRSVADDPDEERDDADVAPPTFTRTAFFPRYRPSDQADLKEEWGREYGFDLGLDGGRTVHGEQSYEFERLPEVGDVLEGTTTLVDVSQRESDERTLTFTTFETAYRDADGELVLTERATNVEIQPEEGDG
jgi:hypothetical protein